MMEHDHEKASAATTLGAVGCSATLFILGLGIAAFVTRDSSGPVASAHAPGNIDAGEEALVGEVTLSLGSEVVMNACLTLEPSAVTCFRESLARDPSAGRRATLEVQIGVGVEGAKVVGGRVLAAPSPFFRPCFIRESRIGDLKDGRSALVIADWDGTRVSFSPGSGR